MASSSECPPCPPCPLMSRPVNAPSSSAGGHHSYKEFTDLYKRRAVVKKFKVAVKSVVAANQVSQLSCISVSFSRVI